ncbi:uncharacterized protein LOC111131736 isoform X3 [Crassostrea virginica]|uniref:Uncharacterized protein LOC111131754 isoform X3 n=1 Tax=Crassostrea virginica TaxID=6565 RepID=A0A8B8E649_CRAVI|nr:uncharacterized protein LOC111131754 isoform X3 [Crassostrea virginica]
MLYRWRTASTNLKLGLVLLSIALVLFVVGFSSSFWVKRDLPNVTNYRDTYGLWAHNKCEEPRGCHEDSINSVYLENRSWTGWFRLTQAVACLGLICMVVALLILLLYFFVSSCKQRKALYAIILFTFLSVLFIVIGIAVFGGKMEQMGYSVGWSMGLAIAGVVLAFFAGIMEVLELR